MRKVNKVPSIGFIVQNAVLKRQMGTHKPTEKMKEDVAVLKGAALRRRMTIGGMSPPQPVRRYAKRETQQLGVVAPSGFLRKGPKLI